jgi:hypothetical protein
MIVAGKYAVMVTGWPRTAMALVAAGLAAVCAGCAGPDQQGDAAAEVARGLLTAVAAGDGTAACAALAPDTRQELAQSAGKPCAAAITEEALPPPGPVETVDVYGQWARVVTSADTLFLATFGDGWRVVAAGCQPRADRPYDCRVQGD